MKNTIKIIGIISLTLVIGFTFFSCSSDGGGGSSGPPPTPPPPPDLRQPGLYAIPPPIVASDAPLALTTTGDNIIAKSIAYINATPGTYTLLLDTDVSTAPTANLTGSSTLTIMGLRGMRTITLSSTGNLFTIKAGTLILGKDITLKGFAINTSSVINVSTTSSSNPARFQMENGSIITGNGARANSDNNKPGAGGAVLVNGGSFFDMKGGEIKGNNAVYGGGVNVQGSIAGTTFTMSGGTITDNTAMYAGSVGDPGYGGGVAVMGSTEGGTFILNSPATKANIHGNQAYIDSVLKPNQVRVFTPGKIQGTAALTTEEKASGW